MPSPSECCLHDGVSHEEGLWPAGLTSNGRLENAYFASPSSASEAACPYLSFGGQGRSIQSGSNTNEE